MWKLTKSPGARKSSPFVNLFCSPNKTAPKHVRAPAFSTPTRIAEELSRGRRFSSTTPNGGRGSRCGKLEGKGSAADIRSVSALFTGKSTIAELPAGTKVCGECGVPENEMRAFCKDSKVTVAKEGYVPGANYGPVKATGEGQGRQRSGSPKVWLPPTTFKPATISGGIPEMPRPNRKFSPQLRGGQPSGDVTRPVAAETDRMARPTEPEKLKEEDAAGVVEAMERPEVQKPVSAHQRPLPPPSPEVLERIARDPDPVPWESVKFEPPAPPPVQREVSMARPDLINEAEEILDRFMQSTAENATSY